MKASLPKVIYIMGPPGAGKGTQAALLAERIGYVQFSTGNAFRQVAAQDTERGRRVKEIIDNGYLTPPEMAAEIVKTAVQKHLARGEGLVFDGTPRTVEEGEIVDDYFVENDYGEPLVILLKVDQEEMMERNAKRVFCLEAEGGDFPVFTPADEERCRKSRGEIGRRPDDDPGKFATRWDEFMNQTYPVVEKYRRQGILREVDGMGTIQEVHEQVMGVIEGFGRV